MYREREREKEKRSFISFEVGKGYRKGNRRWWVVPTVGFARIFRVNYWPYRWATLAGRTWTRGPGGSFNSPIITFQRFRGRAPASVSGSWAIVVETRTGANSLRDECGVTSSLSSLSSSPRAYRVTVKSGERQTIRAVSRAGQLGD